MADNNPLRGAYLTCSNEIRRLVIRASTVGLQGHRARDEADLQERIRAFELAPEHATGYFRHIGNNCASYTEGKELECLIIKINK